MTQQSSRQQASGRPVTRRLVAGAGAVVAALAIPSLPATGAAAATAGRADAGTGQPAAAASSGTLRAWGNDNDGQVGDGSQNSGDPVPVKVKLPPGTKITQVRAGCLFTLALTSTGKVLAWGDNTFGQLGNGSTGGISTIPVAVSLPPGTTVKAVRAGCRHSLALTTTGKVLAWGYNIFGQLGNGSFSDSSTPVRVQLPASLAVTALGSGPAADVSAVIVHRVR